MEKTNYARMLLNSILASQHSCHIFDHKILDFMINNSTTDVIDIIHIPSNSSEVFLLTFKENKKSFLFKIRAIDKNKDTRKLWVETTAFELLKKKIKISEPILYGVSNGYEISIQTYLEGKTANVELLSENKILNIWKLILEVQNILSQFSKNLNLAVPEDGKFADKVVQYTFNFLNCKLSSDEIRMISEHLDTGVLKESCVVFSDRNPTNWILHNDYIVPIDFDLLLVEPRLADFIQFIDDYRLSTKYTRSGLINKCLLFLKEHGYLFSEEDFHWCAVYRNLVQGAIFYKTNRVASKLYYENALDSASFIGLKSLQIQIKEIINKMA